MNKTRLIWGFICLALAGVLAVLSVTLPESPMFNIGETNMPWVPPVILGVVGIVLLATASRGEQRTAEIESREGSIDPKKAALNKRLESIAWGLFLIMLGGFALVPNEMIPKGLWSIGVGVIMLGLNALRYFYRMRMSGFTTFLGILSVLGGILELFGVTSLEGALLLIILGAFLIVKPWFDQHQIFGKAEESRL